MAGNMKDFATGIVVTPPSPADSGTTLVLQTGEGARMPATPFFATAHPPTQFPTLDNAEKIEVTDVTSDTITFTRAEGDTSAQDIEAGWRITNALFLENIPDELADLSGDMDDIANGSTYVKTENNYTDAEVSKLAGIEAGADVTDATNVDAAGATMNSDTNVKTNSWVLDQDNMSGNDDTKVPTQQSVKAYVDAAIATAKSALFPVGSYYINETDSTNPGTLLGFGTWTAAAVGRVPVGKASSGTFQTAGATGGAETHTLTTSEMPSHNHDMGTINRLANVGDVQNGAGNLDDWPGSGGPISATNAVVGNSWTGSMGNTGGGGAHNNLQPYIVVYIWKRTA